MIPSSSDSTQALKVAVVIPCRDEAACIGKVVKDFQTILPAAAIHVCDNGSTDDSVAIARSAGAIVHSEPLTGKGNVIRRMFSDIDADIYVVVDGDDTYHHASTPAMIERLESEGLDMVVAARIAQSDAAYRPGHRLGNAILTGLVAVIFGNRITDMLSGFRVFSRRFVKSFPALSTGFETETELTVHALELRMPIAEIPTPYSARPADSNSKLNTISDGWRILKTILRLIKAERPFGFFGAIGGALAAASVILAWPLFWTYLETGLVPRFPTAILSTGLMLLAFLSLACGVILDSVTLGRREVKRLTYLSVPRHDAAQ